MKSATPSIKNTSDAQATQTKALGGMPPTKDAKAIATANTPSVRKAPDSFRPK